MMAATGQSVERKANIHLLKSVQGNRQLDRGSAGERVTKVGQKSA